MLNSTKLKRDEEEDRKTENGRNNVEFKRQWLLGSCSINNLGERLLRRIRTGAELRKTRKTLVSAFRGG